MCSGRGYHVLGDFSFKTIDYEFASNFVYLFMYPFVDDDLSICHARARLRVCFLVCVVAAITRSTWQAVSRW